MADEPIADFTQSVRVLKAEADAHALKGKALVHMLHVMEEAERARVLLLSFKDKVKFHEDEIAAIAERQRNAESQHNKIMKQLRDSELEQTNKANERLKQIKSQLAGEEAELTARTKTHQEKIIKMDAEIAEKEALLANASKGWEEFKKVHGLT